jgi:hypothetical protein
MNQDWRKRRNLAHNASRCDEEEDLETTHRTESEIILQKLCGIEEHLMARRLNGFDAPTVRSLASISTFFLPTIIFAPLFHLISSFLSFLLSFLSFPLLPAGLG